MIVLPVSVEAQVKFLLSRLEAEGYVLDPAGTRKNVSAWGTYFKLSFWSRGGGAVGIELETVGHAVKCATCKDETLERLLRPRPLPVLYALHTELMRKEAQRLMHRPKRTSPASGSRSDQFDHRGRKLR